MWQILIKISSSNVHYLIKHVGYPCLLWEIFLISFWNSGHTCKRYLWLESKIKVQKIKLETRQHYCLSVRTQECKTPVCHLYSPVIDILKSSILEWKTKIKTITYFFPLKPASGDIELQHTDELILSYEDNSQKL